jgi:diguanylate cyclase (GGDEF)-like protein
MALEGAEIRAMHYRPPWYWLVLIAVAASLATWLIAADARSRIAQDERQFQDGQWLRLQLTEQRIENYFLGAIQLTATGAQMLGPKPLSSDAARDVVVGLYRSRVNPDPNPAIYGVGEFCAPYTCASGQRLFEVYVHAAGQPGQARSRFDQNLPGSNAAAIVVGSNSHTYEDDYTRWPWYQRAVKKPDVTVFFGPYTQDGVSFISTLKAFKRNGLLVGVMAVDTLTDSFVAAMRAKLVSGDIAYVESSSRGHRLVGTAHVPSDTSQRREISQRIRFAGGYLHLTTDAVPLIAKNGRTASTALLYGAVVWIFAAIFGAAIVRGWRARAANLALELQRARLVNELAVGKKVEGELRKAAYTDLLTALPNRAVFMERASEALARVAAGTNRYAVFFIDLDRFNVVNDTLGHFAGDELLKMIAARLRSELPGDAFVARLGGDEFLVLAETSMGDAGVFADQILASLHEPMLLGGRAIYTNASIGIVALDEAYERPEEVLRDADIAMYAAKVRGRGCYAIFDAAMRQKVSADSDLDDDLRNAIERHEFVPYYQPIMSIATRSVISFEALVRWNRPGQGVVAAGEFIEFAESRGLIDAIDEDVLDNVCADAAALVEHFPDATVAVNISAVHLTAPGLAASVERALLARKVAPERIKLEITETAVMTNAAVARATLDQLRDDGMQIVLDDFGAGHSSLAYLHRLPIAGLKIDRSFIEPLATDSQAVAIVRSIVALAQTLDLYTVAEGVETAAQLEILHQLGVHYAQGFFFSPALSLTDLFRFSAQSNAS